ncbi:hypothetical protein [Trebonia sp.]|uniref:hypothetical protein n=1 Tax=Trebonia sp. TaxID=2767075 RepID=UPI0026124B6B|nr:hypothetical protein [Trebonia sp.]
MVRQEIYGCLLAHHAISALICQAATEADVAPDWVSFTRTVRIIRRAIGPAASPPEREEHLRAAVKADTSRKQDINPQRRHRTCPRAIKRARHNSYRVKRARHKGTRHAGPPTITPRQPAHMRS